LRCTSPLLSITKTSNTGGSGDENQRQREVLRRTGFALDNCCTGYGIYTMIITALSLIAGVGSIVIDAWAFITYIWWWTSPEYAAMFGLALTHAVLSIIYVIAVVIFGILGMFLGAAQLENIPMSKKAMRGGRYGQMVEDVVIGDES